jgi:hypothetical protein
VSLALFELFGLSMETILLATKTPGRQQAGVEGATGGRSKQQLAEDATNKGA